jgi:SAM-dependent methyltransferase
MLAENFPDRCVVATDTAREMVSLLRNDLRERHLGTVLATEGEAENLSAFVRQAAGVLSCFTLDLLPNPVAALSDWSRCLRGGGSLVVIFWTRPRTGSPLARLQSVIQAKTGKGRLLWEARALDRLRWLSLRLIRDERAQFEIPWESPEEYFDALFEAGPLQLVKRRFGLELISECRKAWRVNHGLRRKGSTWVDFPEARLWVLERSHT